MPKYKEFESLRAFANRRLEELGRSGELMTGYGKLSIEEFCAVLESEYYDTAADAAEIIQGYGGVTTA